MSDIVVDWHQIVLSAPSNLRNALARLKDENDQLRADLRNALELLRAHGMPPDWITLGDAADWNRRYGELLAKHKETNQ